MSSSLPPPPPPPSTPHDASGAPRLRVQLEHDALRVDAVVRHARGHLLVGHLVQVEARRVAPRRPAERVHAAHITLHCRTPRSRLDTHSTAYASFTCGRGGLTPAFTACCVPHLDTRRRDSGGETGPGPSRSSELEGRGRRREGGVHLRRVDGRLALVERPALFEDAHELPGPGDGLRLCRLVARSARDRLQQVQPERVPWSRVEQRVLDVHEVLREPPAGLHVAEHEAASAQQVLERPQAHVVEVRVDAAEVMQVHVAHGIHAVDVLPERAVALQEPGVMLAHEALVVLVAPQHMRPVREAVAPRVRPVREARRQLRSLPALVHEARERLRPVPLDAQLLRRRVERLQRLRRRWRRDGEAGARREGTRRIVAACDLAERPVVEQQLVEREHVAARVRGGEEEHAHEREAHERAEHELLAARVRQSDWRRRRERVRVRERLRHRPRGDYGR